MFSRFARFFIAYFTTNLPVVFLEQRAPSWSRTLSSPAAASGIASWINSGKLGLDRPRSSSVPLVLYKRKYTLQFDRQQTSLTESAIDRHEEGREQCFTLSIICRGVEERGAGWDSALQLRIEGGVAPPLSVDTLQVQGYCFISHRIILEEKS